MASAVASVAGLDLHEWGLWWEFHREEYLDLRGCLAGRALLDRDLATERLVGSLAAAEHGNVAAAAAVVLGRLSDPSAVPGLLEAVADPERPVVVREFTAAALGLIGESDLRSWRVELSSDLFSAAMTAKVHGGAGRGLLNIL